MQNQLTHNKNSLTVSIPELKQLLIKASEATQEIVKARYSGSMFRDMGQANLETSAELIIADLAVLTGIRIPTGEAFKRLIDLTAESLRKDYPLHTVPLVQIGLKKHSSILTTGKDKSYGRTLAVTDLHQVMDSFLFEVQDADKEADKIKTDTYKGNILEEDEKQNKIRATIEETYQSGDFERCTYADFNQLMKDGILTENSLKKTAWTALTNLKKKYIHLAALVNGSEDKKSIKGVVDVRKYHEKIDLISELENDIKAEAAKLYMTWAKEHYKPVIYIQA